MLPTQRVVTRMPVRELWDESGSLPLRRSRDLSASDIRQLMRYGLARLCVADVGLPLRWPEPSTYFSFLKNDVLPRLVNPADANSGFHLETYPQEYAFVASEWIGEIDGVVVLLEKHH